MLCNTLNKKYLAEEQPPPPIVSSDDSNSMEVAGYAEHALLTSAPDQQQIEDSSLKELEELFCATCGDVHTSFRNQLVECSDCHLLYHQECHTPAINDADAQSDWQCSKCRSSPLPLESSSVLTSSSSSSSSPTVFAQSTKTSSSSSGSSKSASHRKSGSGGGSTSKSSSSSKSGGSGGGSSSSGLISADKRLANMKKKAAKMQKTK